MHHNIMFSAILQVIKQQKKNG